MRPIAIVLIVVATLIAGLAAALMNRFLSDQAAKPVAASKVAETTIDEVLVAAADIPAGVIIKNDDLRYVLWPVNDGNTRLVRRGSGDDPKAGFAGAIARRRLMAGEPMTAEVVFRQDEAGVLAGLLSPGMRAMSVPVTAVSGVNGFILPNDRVDVLLNMDLRAQSQGGEQSYHGGDIAHFSSEVVLGNVRVLAVDTQLGKADGPAVNAKTVTLEVSPRDAEALAAAEKMGDISLTLRSLAPGPAEDPPRAGYIGDVQVSQALRAFFGGLSNLGATAPPASSVTVEVRVNRAGATSVQRFPN
jgi:pilus assembly protein CpaB